MTTRIRTWYWLTIIGAAMALGAMASLVGALAAEAGL